MNKYIGEELRRAFLSKKTIGACLIALLLVFIGMFQYIRWIPSGDVSILYVFLSGYNSGTASFLAVLFPLIVSIPFATSYIEDCKSGFNKYIYLRINKNRYLFIRLLINGLVGGFVLCIAPIISMIFLLVIKLITNATMLKEEIETVTYFNNLGVNSPISMMVIICGMLFCCGFIVATFALGLSTIVQNIYLTILVPFILLIVSAVVFSNISEKLNLIGLYDINHFGMTFTERFIYGGILLLIGVILFYRIGYRLEEKNA